MEILRVTLTLMTMTMKITIITYSYYKYHFRDMKPFAVRVNGVQHQLRLLHTVAGLLYHHGFFWSICHLMRQVGRLDR